MNPEANTEAANRTAATAAKPRPKKAETAKVAKAYFQAVTDRDVEGMIALWEPGGIGHIHGIADLRAPDGYRKWFGDLFRAFPDMRFEVLDLTCEADKAAVRWRAAGNFTGDARFEGFIANGATMEMEGIDLLTIREGLLRELRAYTNGMVIARQIGALPPAGSPAEKAMAGAFNLKTRAAELLKRDS